MYGDLLHMRPAQVLQGVGLWLVSQIWVDIKKPAYTVKHGRGDILYQYIWNESFKYWQVVNIGASHV